MQCVYVCVRMIITVNTNYFPTQHSPVGLSDRRRLHSMQRTDCILIHNIMHTNFRLQRQMRNELNVITICSAPLYVAM